MQSTARPRPIGWRVSPREQRAILLIGDAFVSIVALFGGLYFWGQKDAWLKFSMDFIQQRVEFWFYLLPLVWMVFLVELYDPHRARNLRKTVAGISLAALAGLLLYALVYLISQKGSLPRLGIGIFLIFASVLIASDVQGSARNRRKSVFSPLSCFSNARASSTAASVEPKAIMPISAPCILERTGFGTMERAVSYLCFRRAILASQVFPSSVNLAFSS